MPSCKSCGVDIPKEQDICSVCYGDVDYGRDGLYRQMIEEDIYRQQMKEEMRKEQEQ